MRKQDQRSYVAGSALHSYLVAKLRFKVRTAWVPKQILSYHPGLRSKRRPPDPGPCCSQRGPEGLWEEHRALRGGRDGVYPLLILAFPSDFLKHLRKIGADTQKEDEMVR